MTESILIKKYLAGNRKKLLIGYHFLVESLLSLWKLFDDYTQGSARFEPDIIKMLLSEDQRSRHNY